MADTIIKVENLGKRYLIKHQQKGNYTALRDVITDKMRSFGKKIVSPLNHKQSSTCSTTEEFWALKDISFEVKQGEVVGIIGRNGAGKSTLLKILSRITEPSKGRIRINGRVASLLEVGTGFHPELTGRENIFLNGAILGMVKSEIKRKFDEIVEFAEVEKFLDTPVKRYSSGMYVRLAFAVAAHLEPEILLVDEVLAVGDAQFQKKCLGKMKDVSGKGRTVLFVSHNLTAVQNLCRNAVLLDSGCLIFSGRVETVIAKYISESRNHHTKIWDSGYCEQQERKMAFLSLSIRNHNHKPSNLLCANKPFYVEIEFEIFLPVNNLRIALRFDNANGEIIFGSYNSDSYTVTTLTPGKYISTCCLPPNLFNVRSYKITLYAEDMEIGQIARCEDVVSFQIGSKGVIGEEYNTERLGSMRPKLKWHTALQTCR
jgi:homopolymeric O-antigen transport system ATP-binding protein